MSNCDDCGFPNPRSVGVVVCRNCGVELLAVSVNDSASHSRTSLIARVASSVVTSVNVHRSRWGAVTVVVLATAVVFVGVSFVTSWSSAQTEPKPETTFRYQYHLRPLLIDIADGWTGIDEQDIPVGLTMTKVCCDGLGMEMVRFEAALPPIRIEAAPDRVAEIVDDINIAAARAGFLTRAVSKFSLPYDEALGRYSGGLDSVLVGWWKIDAEVVETPSGEWTLHLTFQTANDR